MNIIFFPSGRSTRSNIVISFNDYTHTGRKYERGRILAFTYYPRNGNIGIDNSELWTSELFIDIIDVMHVM